MNFEEYKEWRDNLIETHHVSPDNRFDCLNPFKAMDFSRKWSAPPSVADVQIGRELELWKLLHFGTATPADLHIEATGGVRAALGELFVRMESEGMELWLPEDVYPFYKQEASTRAPNLAIRYFRTIPRVDFSSIHTASDKAVLLITNPLTPTGRFFEGDERAALAGWASQSRHRWVIFDAVYSYSSKFPLSLHSPIETDRFIYLFSMSKSWLLRGVYGTIVGARNAGDWWKNLGQTPAMDIRATVLRILATDYLMPERQTRIFSAEWKRRWGKLRKYGPYIDTPGAGYFKLIPVNFERAFKEDGLVLVPASVFGSTDMDWSIATCLYEAAAFSREA